MATYPTGSPFTAGLGETVSRLNYASTKADYIVANKFPTVQHRGLEMGSGLGPVASLAPTTQVCLVTADEIVMSDGERIPAWSNLLLDSAVSGAVGGLDTGSLAANAWYEIYGIRNSSSGAKGLLAHLARNFATDQSYAIGNADSTGNLRQTSSLTQIAQGVKTSAAVPIAAFDAWLTRVSTPTGNIWCEVQADSAGVPSGTSLATSDAIPVANLATASTQTRFIFRNQFTTAGSSTQYWIVIKGDYTINGTAYVTVQMDGSSPTYANGSYATNNGSTWSADATKDICFNLISQPAATALSLPSGYDQSGFLGHVFWNGSAWRRFTQIGKIVSYQIPDAVLTGTFTNLATAPLIIPLPNSVPPVPCMANLRVGHSVAANGVIVSPAAVGPLMTTALGAYIGYSIPGSATVSSGPLPPVPLDHPAIYVAVNSAGTAQVFVAGYTLP